MTDSTKTLNETVDVDALRRENESMRKRITELEAQNATQQVELLKQTERSHLLNTIVQNSPYIIFVKALDGTYMVVNKEVANLYGTTCEALMGLTDGHFFPAEAANAMRIKDQEILAYGEPIRFDEDVPIGDEMRNLLTLKFPVTNVAGDPIGVCGIAMDVTEQKKQEAERLAMREQVIMAQNEALRELSTPLVPIADGVMAMPLVGAIDHKRAELILTALLEGVSKQSAHTVIMDITGVRTVDAQVAEALVTAARSVRLLGARVIITGVRPDVARILVDLGTDLQGIVTRATLRSGIAFALGT